MPEDDRVAVELAARARVDGVLAAHVGATGVDGQRVGHVRVGDPGLHAVVDPILDVRLRVVVERAVAGRDRIRVAVVRRLRDHDVGVGQVGDAEVARRPRGLLRQFGVGVGRAAWVAGARLRQAGDVV